jgi:hypothetical protein
LHHTHRLEFLGGFTSKTRALGRLKFLGGFTSKIS